MSARAGRRIAIGLLFAGLAAFVVGSTTQIVWQVFFAEGRADGAEASPMPWASCREGLVSLNDAVARARVASEGESDVGAALARFRAALQPEWSHVEGVREACRGNEADQHSLDAVERLRYAEEHAVRREASSLEVLRKQVARELLGATSSAASHDSAPDHRAP